MKDHQFSFSYSLLDDNREAISTVDMGIQGDCLAWPEVVDRFTEFLRGCGYVFDHHETLGLVPAP